MVLPVLAVLVGAALWGIAVAAAQLRCVDAARDAARAAARGEPPATVIAAARAAAPAGAQIVVDEAAGQVVVSVRARVGPGVGPLARLPVPTAAATAYAVPEPAP